MQALKKEILDWAEAFKHTPLFGIYDKAEQLIKSNEEDPVFSEEDLRKDFENLKRMEPLRERISLYAMHLSGTGEREHEYHMQVDELQRLKNDPNASEKAIKLKEEQVRYLWVTCTQTYKHPTDRWNRYGLVDNAYQDAEAIEDFDRVKGFIAWLEQPDTDPLDVQDRFESWKREHRREKYQSYSVVGSGRRGGKSAYEKAFNSAYYRYKH